MSTAGIVIYYIGCGYQSPNTQEIQCFKWNFVFILGDIFQEHNSGVKQDLLV